MIEFTEGPTFPLRRRSVDPRTGQAPASALGLGGRIDRRVCRCVCRGVFAEYTCQRRTQLDGA